MIKKTQSYKIPIETDYLLKELASYNNTNKSYMLDYLIRKACKGKKLTIL